MSSIVIACAACRTDNSVPAQQLLSRPRCSRCQAALSLAAPIELNRDAVEAVLQKAPIPVLLVLYSQWNAASSMAAPVLAEVAQRHAGRLLVGRINTDMHPDVMKRYAATSLPALILFRGGSERKRLLGAHSAPQIEQMISDSGAPR
jgi:thioredoxin-like negative regulator of GroEL